MRVRVILFGPYAHAAGVGEVECDLPGRAQATAGDVIEALGRSAPAVQSMLAAARLAVNHQFASREQIVTESDEVALIGLVGGG